MKEVFFSFPYMIIANSDEMVQILSRFLISKIHLWDFTYEQFTPMEWSSKVILCTFFGSEAATELTLSGLKQPFIHVSLDCTCTLQY